MVKITNNSANGIAGVVELTADTFSELSTNVTAVKAAMGSVAIVLEGGLKVYMKNGSGEWVEL